MKLRFIKFNSSKYSLELIEAFKFQDHMIKNYYFFNADYLSFVFLNS